MADKKERKIPMNIVFSLTLISALEEGTMPNNPASDIAEITDNFFNFMIIKGRI